MGNKLSLDCIKEVVTVNREDGGHEVPLVPPDLGGNYPNISK